MTEQTHKITVTIDGRYIHGANQYAQVCIAGDGGLEHMLETFRAALVAAGFATQTAQALEIAE